MDITSTSDVAAVIETSMFDISSGKISSRTRVWEIPYNYRDFIRVMVFCLFCWRIIMILVTAVFCHILYIYTFNNDIYIGEPPGNKCLKLRQNIYIHIKTSIKLYITIIYFHRVVSFANIP